jgi:hypothetical protein
MTTRQRRMILATVICGMFYGASWLWFYDYRAPAFMSGSLAGMLLCFAPLFTEGDVNE